MLNFDYLDSLYRWKIEAEQELQKLEKEDNDPIVKLDIDYRILKIRIENATGLVNRYATAIKIYLSHYTV